MADLYFKMVGNMPWDVLGITFLEFKPRPLNALHIQAHTRATESYTFLEFRLNKA